MARRLREGAVMADIATQMGERQKNFARIGDDIAKTAIAQLRGGVQQARGIGDSGQGLRLRDGQPEPGAAAETELPFAKRA
jgi:hypothetical protein